ncbi:MAG: hypothetical protein L6V93_14155 [Clostridiales bacterium]|nr:MAG: hypothetical protein L6V93_14155 [Clostridiales bacterium]
MPKKLKITIPENLNYNDVFKDILEKYTKKYMLTKVRTTDLGSLFEAGIYARYAKTALTSGNF